MISPQISQTDSRLSRHPNRFRLCRAGIRNVWQYDDQEFQFGEGRLLLRGKNGAGKSKALEMLLPYLLDGEARRLDATGSGKTTLGWLMLDGVRVTNRLGYLWVEFGRLGPDDVWHWLTLGAAVRASASSKETKPVFFVTTLRVGHELRLVSDGQPLAIDQLRELVGQANCYDRPVDYRARVMRGLFGLVDPARYRNLVHLLYRLRRPTLGDRIESGELATVLTEALPPLDDEIIDRVAHNLDDLDTVREELGRLESTEAALRTFVGHYRGYLHGVLRGRVRCVREELDVLAAVRKQAGDAERMLATLTEQEKQAATEVERLLAARDAAEADLRGLRESHAYHSLDELRDRRSTVSAMVAAATSCWLTHELAHRGELCCTKRLAAHVDQVGCDMTTLRALLRARQRDARDCGLEDGLLGQAPSVTAATLAAAATWTGTDVDGRSHRFERPPIVMVDRAVESGLADWRVRLEETARVAKARLRLVDELDRQLDAVLAAEREADRLGVDADRLDGELEVARTLVDQRAAEVAGVSADYADAIRSWVADVARHGVQAPSIVDLVVLPGDPDLPAGERSLGRGLPSQVASAARAAIEPVLTDLDGRRDAAVAQEWSLDGELRAARRAAAQGEVSRELDQRLAEAAECRGVLDAQRAAVRQAERDLPSGTRLLVAWAAFDDQETTAARLMKAFAVARKRAEEARAAASGLRRKAEAAATTDALPTNAATLAELRSRLKRFLDGVQTVDRDIARLTGVFAAQQDEKATLEREVSTVEQARDEYLRRYHALTEARTRLAALEQALDASQAQVAAAERKAARRYDDAVAALPAARRRQQELHDAWVRAGLQRDDRVAKRREQERQVVDSGGQLRRPLGATGLMLAARFDGVESVVQAYDSAQSGDVRGRISALRQLAEEVATRLGRPATDVSDTVILKRHDELRDSLAGGYDVAVVEEQDIKRFELHDDAGVHDVAVVGARLRAEVEAARARLSSREHETFERYLLGELGDHLSRQVLAATGLLKAMNDTLAEVRTSHGLGARLVWELPGDVEVDIRAAAELLRQPSALRTKGQSTQLREALQRRIEDARRADPTAGYAVHLRAALDYRAWFAFRIQVTDEAKPGRFRVLSHRTALSQGEQRVMSYLVLFATAAAHFTSLARGAPDAPRLILLDDAFAKVDEPTHGRLLGLLVELDLDFVLTSERLWGCFPTVPKLHIYECLRDPHVRGVATVHFTWDGRNKKMVAT